MNWFIDYRKARIQNVAVTQGMEVKVVVDGKEIKQLISKIKTTPVPERNGRRYPRIGDTYHSEKAGCDLKYFVGECQVCKARTKDWLRFCCNDTDCSCNQNPSETMTCPQCKADEWLKDVTETDTEAVLSFLQS